MYVSFHDGHVLLRSHHMERQSHRRAVTVDQRHAIVRRVA